MLRSRHLSVACSHHSMPCRWGSAVLGGDALRPAKSPSGDSQTQRRAMELYHPAGAPCHADAHAWHPPLRDCHADEPPPGPGFRRCIRVMLSTPHTYTLAFSVHHCRPEGVPLCPPGLYEQAQRDLQMSQLLCRESPELGGQHGRHTHQSTEPNQTGGTELSTGESAATGGTEECRGQKGLPLATEELRYMCGWYSIVAPVVGLPLPLGMCGGRA